MNSQTSYISVQDRKVRPSFFSLLVYRSLRNTISDPKPDCETLASEVFDSPIMETEPRIYQLFVTLLDGKTLVLNYATPQISARDVRTRLSEITGVPASLQRLVTGTRDLGDESAISCGGERRFPAVAVAARLRGGKGGFGSLLRGAGSKAWQKKTSNMDACRDMSGRRLRHVNAERRLEEWRAGEEERRLERKAEEFLRKMAKKGKRGVGDGEAEKYVAKYRADSERCVSEVLDSVKEAVKGKRKEGSSKGSASEAKRLKIWTGKRKLAESDSDDSEDEEEKEKSTVSNDDCNGSDSSKDAEGSSDSVTGKKQDGELSGGDSSESGSEEEKENLVLESKESGGVPNEDSHCDMQKDASESVHGDKKVSEASEGVEVWDEKANHDEPVVENGSTPSCRDEVERTLLNPESPSLVPGPGGSDEAGSSKEAAEIEIPLNFDKFNLAAELEALGMDRLKSELQARGLKCGGTLQERAARLFLLKSTPLDKLPKKLLAKK